MGRLMTRTLALVSGALAAFVLVLALVIVLSSGSLLRSWEERESRGLASFIEERLSSLAEELEAAGARPSSQAVAAALADLPYEPDSLIVLSADNAPLYLLRRRDAQEGQGRMMGRMRQAVGDYAEVRTKDGRLAFKYEAVTGAFDQRESNRVLMAALSIILVAGSLIAALIAALVAYSLARPISRRAGQLASSLEEMARGRRDLVLGSSSIAELDRIGQAAGLLQASLAREEELRRRWAADIAHDLRTPLASLKAQMEAMRDGVFEPSPGRIESGCREIERLEKLVGDLALLTRLETPDFRPSLGPVGLEDFARGMARRFEAAGSNIKVTLIGGASPEPGAGGPAPAVAAAGAVSPSILADEGLLDRAVSNLVDNAIRYGREGGKVELRAESLPGGGAAIRVVNEGLIDEAVLPFAFERSFRADSSRGSPGSGLGLAIAKAAAEAQGARIEASRDEAACATAFSIVFTSSLPPLP